MRLPLAVITLSILLCLILAGYASAVEEVKLFGVIQKIVTTTDGTEAAVTMKESTTGTVVVITVIDTLTLDKFRDKRIVEGDDIRCKYEVIGTRKISRLFKKTVGC